MTPSVCFECFYVRFFPCHNTSQEERILEYLSIPRDALLYFRFIKNHSGSLFSLIHSKRSELNSHQSVETPISCSGEKSNLIIVTESVVFCRRLRWDTYCRNDPSEYGLTDIHSVSIIIALDKIFPCVLLKFSPVSWSFRGRGGGLKPRVSGSNPSKHIHIYIFK